MARLSRSQAAASARYLRPYITRLYLRGLKVRSATHTATSRPTLHRARMQAVSYGGPDFKFVNNSEYPLAIKASFSASDRKLTIALYGVPILKEGVKIRMSSEKTGEIDPPSAVYTEDGSLQPGQEVQTKAATPGSRWSTDLVTYENDKEVSREFFHNSSYRGKAAQIKRNSSATVATNATETTAAAESTGS